jgi:hypothetical protein
MHNSETTFNVQTQESLRLFFLECYMDKITALVRHLSDTIFILSVAESDLFRKHDIQQVYVVLKKLAIILEDRVSDG